MHDDENGRRQVREAQDQADQLAVNAALLQFFRDDDRLGDGLADHPDQPGQRRVMHHPQQGDDEGVDEALEAQHFAQQVNRDEGHEGKNGRPAQLGPVADGGPVVSESIFETSGQPDKQIVHQQYDQESYPTPPGLTEDEPLLLVVAVQEPSGRNNVVQGHHDHERFLGLLFVPVFRRCVDVRTILDVVIEFRNS